jgi:DNA-binding IclR family transcriptional regulator
MAAAPLAPDLRRFVAAKIHSVPMLEALLLLRSREAGWSRAELAARLYLPESRVETLVRELCRERLAGIDGEAIRYSPEDASIAALVDELAGTYSRHVVAVTEIIHSGLERKARDFADAFVLRRDE